MKTIEETGKVSFSHSVKDFWQGYFDFRGQSTRAGFWWSQLCIILIYTLLFVILGIDASRRSYYDAPISPLLLFIIIVFSLAIIVPSLALFVRRLRNIGLKSKTILVLFVLYYGFYGTYIIGTYSSIMSNISSLISQYSENYTTPVMQISSSPFITLFFMMISGFFFISLFLPTNMLATNSKHPFLQSIFSDK